MIFKLVYLFQKNIVILKPIFAFKYIHVLAYYIYFMCANHDHTTFAS